MDQGSGVRVGARQGTGGRHPQDLAVERGGILGAVGLSGVADRCREHAVRAEGDATAVMIPGLGEPGENRVGLAERIGTGCPGQWYSHDAVVRGSREVDVKPAVRGRARRRCHGAGCRAPVAGADCEGEESECGRGDAAQLDSTRTVAMASGNEWRIVSRVCSCLLEIPVRPKRSVPITHLEDVLRRRG